MIIGDGFTTIKGFLAFEPKIIKGSKGDFAILNVRVFRFKGSDNKNVYQTIKVLVNQKNVIEKMLPQFKVDSDHTTYVEVYGTPVFKYAKNDRGYEDLQKLEDAYVEFGQFGRTEVRQKGNQTNRTQSSNNNNNNRSNNQGEYGTDPFGGTTNPADKHNNPQVDPFGGSSSISDDDLPF